MLIFWAGSIYKNSRIIWIRRFIDCNILADHVHLPQCIGSVHLWHALALRCDAHLSSIGYCPLIASSKNDVNH